MANIVFTLLSLVVIFLAVVWNKKSLDIPTPSNQVLAETTTEQTPAPTPTPSPTQTVIPTLIPKATPVSFWQYPHSNRESENDTSFTATTEDGATIVFDWYRSQIQNRGYHSITMAQTSTIDANGTGPIIDKIVATDGRNEVRVDIGQTLPSNTVTILVDVTALEEKSSVSANDSSHSI